MQQRGAILLFTLLAIVAVTGLQLASLQSAEDMLDHLRHSHQDVR